MSLKTKLVAKAAVACGAMFVMFGCGSSGAAGVETTATQSMRLQGTIPRAVRLLDNARVVAIGSDGKHFWTYVDAGGHFSLAVPPGASYRVIVTNAQRVGPDRVTAHLSVTTSKGASKWLGIHGGGTIDLGVLSTTGAAASSITTKSEGEGAASSDGEHAATSDDAETHEDDGPDSESESACSDHDGKDDPTTTEDDDDLELEAEHDPGDRVHDDLEAEHDDDKVDTGEADDEGPCTAGGGGGGGGATPPPATPPAATAPPATTVPPPATPPPAATPPTAPGSVGLGGACHVSADCSGALTCAASTCSVIVVR